jgi:hypothetical protein
MDTFNSRSARATIAASVYDSAQQSKNHICAKNSDHESSLAAICEMALGLRRLGGWELAIGSCRAVSYFAEPTVGSARNDACAPDRKTRWVAG